MEVIFGLIGVLIGSFIPWFHTYWVEKRTIDKNARYLAIRVVCVLDKYLEDCAEVVKDDGLSYGQRTSEGYLTPQVEAPGAPVFPNDVDWKSINHELMYKILSLPAEVESADRLIKAAWEISDPPDFSAWFNERKFHYCQFGLMAYTLSETLCTKYSIKKKRYNDWDPLVELKFELNTVKAKRQKKFEEYGHFINEVFPTK